MYGDIDNDELNALLNKYSKSDDSDTSQEYSERNYKSNDINTNDFKSNGFNTDDFKSNDLNFDDQKTYNHNIYDRKEEDKLSVKNSESEYSPVDQTEINEIVRHSLAGRKPEKDEIDRHTDAIRRRARTSYKTNRKRKFDIITNILLVVFIVLLLGSGADLGIYYINLSKSESKFEELKTLIDTDSNTVAPDDIDEAEKKENYITYVDVNGVQVQSKYVNLYKRNNDFIGWLMIPETKIDYPVMYTPSDEQYYLHTDFDKENNYAGTLFLGKGSDYVKPSDNIVIYGHNMKAGTMFHDLLLYEDEDFYKKHKYVYFHTIENNGDYEIIAAFRTVINEEKEDSFKYYEFFDADNKEEFDEYVNKVKEMTPYDIPVSAEYGDKLITLSTCAYHANQGRYVVVAKKIN